MAGLLEELQRYRALVDSAAGGGRRIGSFDGSSGLGAAGQERGGADGSQGSAESQYMRMLQRRLHAADQQHADYEQQLQQLAVQVGVVLLTGSACQSISQKVQLGLALALVVLWREEW